MTSSVGAHDNLLPAAGSIALLGFSAVCLIAEVSTVVIVVIAVVVVVIIDRDFIVDIL